MVVMHRKQFYCTGSITRASCLMCCTGSSVNFVQELVSMNQIYKYICICTGSDVYVCGGGMVSTRGPVWRSGSIPTRCCPLKDPSLERVCGFSLGIPGTPALHLTLGISQSQLMRQSCIVCVLGCIVLNYFTPFSHT
jgi:hypothetical protein